MSYTSPPPDPFASSVSASHSSSSSQSSAPSSYTPVSPKDDNTNTSNSNDNPSSTAPESYQPFSPKDDPPPSSYQPFSPKDDPPQDSSYQPFSPKDDPPPIDDPNNTHASSSSSSSVAVMLPSLPLYLVDLFGPSNFELQFKTRIPSLVPVLPPMPMLSAKRKYQDMSKPSPQDEKKRDLAWNEWMEKARKVKDPPFMKIAKMPSQQRAKLNPNQICTVLKPKVDEANNYQMKYFDDQISKLITDSNIVQVWLSVTSFSLYHSAFSHSFFRSSTLPTLFSSTSVRCFLFAGIVRMRLPILMIRLTPNSPIAFTPTTISSPPVIFSLLFSVLFVLLLFWLSLSSYLISLLLHSHFLALSLSSFVVS
jgi:hypothetical protein